MAKKRSTPPIHTAKPITAERASRLYRLLRLVEKGPQSRAVLIKRLRLDIRGFYRDLELLRDFGIILNLSDRGYGLEEKVDVALARLPFPDPRLTLGEAQQLAKGRSAAHRKLKEQINAIVG